MTNKKIKNIEYHLNKFCEVTRVQNHSVSYSSFYQTNMIIKVLSWLLMDKVKSLGIDDQDVAASVVRKALFRWRKYKNTNLRYFERALKHEVSEYLGLPEQEYNILFFVNCRPDSFSPDDKIYSLGRTFQIRRANELREKIEALQEETHGWLPRRLNLMTFLPITINCNGKDASGTLDTVLRAFNLYRSLLNFKQAFRRITFQNRPSPLGGVLPSPVYGIFDSTGSLEHAFYEVELDSNYNLRILENDQIDFAKQKIGELGNPTNSKSTDYLLVEILLKFQEALDTAIWTQSFLTMWQCLELAAYTNDSQLLKHTEVAKRVNSLIEKVTSEHKLIADLTKCLAHTRNELVHRGTFSRNELHEVQLLKYVVETMVVALLELRSDYPTTHHLEEFYRHANQNNTTLERKRKAIDTILADRNAGT